MSEKKVVLVVRLKDPAHSGGRRIVTHRSFTKEPSVAYVTEAQADEIKKDPYLYAEQRCSEPWLKAFGLEFTEQNETKYRRTTPPFTQRTNFAEIIDPAPLPNGEMPKKEELPVLEEVGPVEEKKTVTSEDVIAALEKQGMKAGVDFEKDAAIESLQSLLK